MATIALDIGGTKIASAIFFPDGSMMFNRKRLLKGRTGHEVGKLAADILAKLLTVARRSRIHIDGIGVCIPGIVYSQTNRVWAPNIPGWDNYPLYEELRSVTPPGIEIYIDSDRTCYMYGEMWQGAAKECHSAIFIAVGTGIGAGIIIDGHVLHGANDIIGATGWMALQPPYREEYDACGCFEYYASGNGIGARVRDAVRANRAYKGKYHIDVDWVMETEEEYRKNLKRMNATDELPAIITDLRMLPSFYQMMIRKGRIEDLTPYINEDQEWKDMIEPSVMESVREEDGKIYLGPVSTAAFACSGVFWNRELYERAGISRFPETWEEFWKCCEKLKAAGITPLALHTEGTAWAPMLLATAEVAGSEERCGIHEAIISGYLSE